MNSLFKFCIVLLLGINLFACGGLATKHTKTKPVAGQSYNDGRSCTAGAKSKYGNPAKYKVLGKWYQVKDSACGFVETGIASWYGPKFHGKRTSSGEIYDMHAMTGAHKTLPIPVMLRVVNLENGRQVVIRVNDRGPFHPGRVVDLSKEAAKRLEILGSGTAKVRIEVIDAPYQNLPQQTVIKDYRNNLYVQIASFSNLKAAQNYRARLQVDGFDSAEIYPFTDADFSVYRVRIGPYVNRQQAEDAQQLLRNMGYREHQILGE